MSLYPFVEPALDALEIWPPTLQIAHIDSLLGCYYPHLSVDRPALIGLLTDESQCQRLSSLLQLAYPTNHAIKIVSLASSAAQPFLQTLSLKALATTSLNQGASLLYLPQLSFTGAVETFQDTVAHLRAPDGCPWDRKQTHRSLRSSFQEEVYEVLDTLDRDDLEGLKEELGDVLLQVLMHAQIASQAGEFQMSDVVQHIQAKIVRRHPHVFAGLLVNDVDEVLTNWEAIKQQEKGTDASRSVLDSVSRAMPSLGRAQSLQRHVDWMDG
ncbi:MAG: MazG family protein, partial [Anaerolineae bacterium]|nr:MazG family protein [Anaerolineae bacterium]